MMVRLISICLAAFLCAFSAASPLAAKHVRAQNVRHGVAFQQQGYFTGWPANEGSWLWDDEIVVGFEKAQYLAQTDDHSLDRSTACLSLARSSDGGKTWKEQPVPEFAPPIYLEEPARVFQKGKPVKRSRQNCPGVADMTADGFALKLRGDVFYVSYDKAHSWEGPYALPVFEEDGALVIPAARTQYHVLGPKSALIFMSSVGPRSEGEKAERGRTYVMRTDDGCKSFQFASWIGPDLEETASGEEKKYPVYSVMPSVVCIGDGHYIAALRQRIHKRKWTDIYESKDEGKTWTFLSKAEEDSGNPPALVALKDGRLALVYGWRGKNMGVRARLSSDKGRSWSDEYILRDDAKTWDLGYVRAHALANGDILALYYYNTPDIPQQHIAYTVWTPPAADKQAAAKK